MRRNKEFSGFDGHVNIDDLGQEKSLWSRTATVTVLANLVYTHYVQKVTQSADIAIHDFYGSAALNIQPILMSSLVQDEGWVTVVRDKVWRCYHLIRPVYPRKEPPDLDISWGEGFNEVKEPKSRGRLFYNLLEIALIQWGYSRCLEHIPDLLRACAAFDGRTTVNTSDYHLLIKLLKPMRLERVLLSTSGFETGRTFRNNVFCLMVELATWKTPSISRICDDYKIDQSTVQRLISVMKEYCWLKTNSPSLVMPTDYTKSVFKAIGVNDTW